MAERSGRLYFGVSDTPKGNLIKEVVIRNPGDLTDEDELDLQVGDELIVKFNNGNNEEVYPQLKLMVNDPAQDVGPTGAIPTVTYPGYNEWSAQQLVGFVYCCGKIAGDVIKGAKAEFDQTQTATASLSEETFLNKVQSTPGTYQFTYHVAEVEEAEETEEATGAWYLNEQIVNLTVYGISCENPVDEDTIIVNVAYVTEHTEDETYYWKAFQIDKATADTYGVTKVFDQLNQLVEGTEDTPIGWGLIDDMLEDRLDDFELNYTGQHHPDDWGTVTLEYPDSLYPSEGHETPNKVIDSFEVPAIVTNTNQLTNGGDKDNPGGKYWVSNNNNFFDESSLGIGYEFTPESSGVNPYVRTIIPWYLDTTNAQDPKMKTTMGYGNLNAYQNNITKTGGALVAPNPSTEIWGNDLIFGMGVDGGSNGLVRSGTSNSEIRFGTMHIPSGVFKDLLWMNGNSANFEVPVNINNGININNVDLNTYVNSRIESHQERDLFIYGQVTSVEITYPAFENTANSDKGSVPGGFGWEAINAAAKAVGQYAPVYNSGGNCRMYIRHINNYVPIAVRGWNVEGADEADDFYVWECWLSDITTSSPQVHFGLQNTRQKKQTVRFKVNILYVRSDYVQQFKIPSGTDPKWNLSNGNIRALNK